MQKFWKKIKKFTFNLSKSDYNTYYFWIIFKLIKRRETKKPYNRKKMSIGIFTKK